MNNSFFAHAAFANISESHMAMDFQSCMLRRDCMLSRRIFLSLLKVLELSPHLPRSFSESLPHFVRICRDVSRIASELCRNCGRPCDGGWRCGSAPNDSGGWQCPAPNDSGGWQCPTQSHPLLGRDLVVPRDYVLLVCRDLVSSCGLHTMMLLL